MLPTRHRRPSAFAGAGFAGLDEGAGNSPPSVMPGLVPGIHAYPPVRPLPACTAMPQDVDARNKSGHDDRGARDRRCRRDAAKHRILLSREIDGAEFGRVAAGLKPNDALL